MSNYTTGSDKNDEVRLWIIHYFQVKLLNVFLYWNYILFIFIIFENVLGINHNGW